MKFVMCSLFFVISLSVFSQEKKASLVITVSNIKTVKGDIHIGVFANEVDFKAKKNQVAKGIYPVDKNSLRVVYKDIPYGAYVIQLFHDVNKNDKVDSTSLGIPLEPFGFSNDIAPGFGLPAFQKCVFQVDSEEIEINVTLQKYKKKWSVGAAGLYSTSPYKDDEGRFYPIPVISYQGDRLSVIGPQVFYTVKRSERWSVDLALRLQFNSYSNSDSETFQDMEDRNMTAEAGLKYQWRFYDKWRLELDAYSDVLFQHKGFHGSLGVSRGFKIKRASLTPSVGYEWQSSDFVDYYYGVKKSEERFDRPEYHGSFNSNAYASISYMQPIKDSWMFMGTVTGKYLGTEITDSPLIEDKYQISFLAAIVYQF